MNCYQAKAGELAKHWFVIDAEGVVVGRLAAQIAPILMGKHRPTYTPHIDTGDFVIVTNVDKVVFTGEKWRQKSYQRYSGYPGGQKEEAAWKLFQAPPKRILELAISRMMPKNKIARHMLAKLKLYVGPNHPHQAQQPIPLEAALGPTHARRRGYVPERTTKANGTAAETPTAAAVPAAEASTPTPVVAAPAIEAPAPEPALPAPAPEPALKHRPGARSRKVERTGPVVNRGRFRSDRGTALRAADRAVLRIHRISIHAEAEGSWARLRRNPRVVMMATAVEHFIWGTGRRKTSVARVRIREGTGQYIVNKLDANVYFPLEVQRTDIRAPLTLTEMGGRVDVFVNVRGGGKHSQSGAVQLGLARAAQGVPPGPRYGPPRRRLPHPRRPDGRTQEVRPQEGPQELPVLQALSAPRWIPTRPAGSRPSREPWFRGMAMGAKQRCQVCGRLQRVPDDAADFLCDGCGGQLGPEQVRRVPPGLGRRLLAIVLMILGALCAVPLLIEAVRQAPLRRGRETRYDRIGLVFPAILIFGGVTVARGKFEPLPAESISE